MTVEIGTLHRPLRVAIIGSGPSGFYAADALFKTKGIVVEVDLFERLPTPYGLVRAGVAPDHQRIKKVVKAYEKTAQNTRFRFIGNVKLGETLQVADLKQHYDQIVYAVGADAGKTLPVPGRGALRYHPAAVVVGWYNGHPDYRRAKYDFSVEKIAIIGHGNVALDVSRIFAKSNDELRETDIAEHALSALSKKKIRDIYVVGFSGPTQATFTPPELAEYKSLHEATAIVDPNDLLKLNLLNASKKVKRNVKILQEYAQTENHKKNIRVHFIFNSTTKEVLVDENGGVSGIRFEKTKTTTDPLGNTKILGTGETYDLDVDMVIPAIGFKTTAIPGVSFDTKAGRISNENGRVTDPTTKKLIANQYVVGWARTGPQGVIGIHKAASKQVVAHMLEDFRAGSVKNRKLLPQNVILSLLKERGVMTLSFNDWKKLDELEITRGEIRGAPRNKLVHIDDMLEAVGKE